MKPWNVAVSTALAALVVGAAGAGAAQGAVSMYLKVPGPATRGESKDPGHDGDMDVLAFSWGISNTLDRRGLPGKPARQDISITKWVDRASPGIVDSVASGHLFSWAYLTVLKPSNDGPQDYLSMCLLGARFTSLSTGGSGGEDRLTENVTLSYQTLVEHYTTQGTGGPTAASVFGGWDFVHNVLAHDDSACTG